VLLLAVRNQRLRASLLRLPCLFSWGENWQQLQESFEQHRARWLGSDRAGWLAKNQPYPGVVEGLQSCEQPVYFASRYQAGWGAAGVLDLS
jgi:hypothetical protein